jgi:glycosyltransferase involved in cell wall biosynthesis
VKHASRVAGISAAATREFRGFGDMLAAQGLPGPDVVECALPVEVPPGDGGPPTTRPLVVCIGSFEPRKNQLAVLHAAEQLWREGLDFELQFIGGGGYTTEFDPLMVRLKAAGRPVRRRNAISDAELWQTLRSARFSVFLSLHEGFGLPVAESLACGTPCLTSEYGSTREIADGGGALVVDPLDDLAIAVQMRAMLTDDALLDSLRQAALRRPPRTWDDYARELWTALLPDGAPR